MLQADFINDFMTLIKSDWRIWVLTALFSDFDFRHLEQIYPNFPIFKEVHYLWIYDRFGWFLAVKLEDGGIGRFDYKKKLYWPIIESLRFQKDLSDYCLNWSLIYWDYSQTSLVRSVNRLPKIPCTKSGTTGFLAFSQLDELWLLKVWTQGHVFEPGSTSVSTLLVKLCGILGTIKCGRNGFRGLDSVNWALSV